MSRAFEVLTKFTAKENVSNATRKIAQGAKIATLAIAAMGAQSVKMAIDFDQGIRKTLTIADQSKISYESLSESMLRSSSKIGISTNDLNESVYQAISAGVETSKAISFTETASKAAIGGFTDTAIAVDGLTSILNAYGLTADKATKISDQLLMTQNLGKTTFGELAQNMGNVIPTAAALNVKTEELFASFASLTTQGINTAESSTAINAVLNSLLSPSAEAAKAAKKMEIEFSAAAVEQKGFAGVMADIERATGGSKEQLAQLFGNVRALKGAMVLTGVGAEGFRSNIDKMQNSVGATDKAFQAMNEGSGRKLEITLNKLKNRVIEFGGALLPHADELAVGMGSILDRFEALDKDTQGTIVKTTALGVSFGLSAIALGALITAVTTIKTALAGLLASKAAVAVISAIGAAAGSAAGLMIAIPAALVAIGVGIYQLQKRVGGVFGALKVIGQTIAQVLLSPLNAAVIAIERFLGLLSSAASFVGLDKVAGLFASGADKVESGRGSVNQAITGTTTVTPGTRMMEAINQGDASNTREEYKTRTPFGGTIDLNVNNFSGFDLSAAGNIPGMNINLNNGMQ